MAIPVVSVGNHSLLHDQWQQLQSWINYSDADGNPAVTYQFWDSGTAASSAYFWTSSNAHWAANSTIEVPASQLSDVWLRGGAAGGSETLWVRAYDGTDWSSWTTFTLTTIPNTVPVATISDQQLHVNQWAQVSTLLSYSDANGDVATKYQFWDSGTAATSARFWTPGTSYWAPNSTLEVPASDLANVWILGGSTTGSETLWVRAFDGYDWGAWDTFTMATTNATPVTAVSDHSLHTGQWATVGSWINVSDADNDAITKYQFWDSGSSATSAYFWTPTNSHWAANTVIDVSAGDLGSVWVQGGAATGSETLWARAFDGTSWSNWSTFTLTTVPNTAPVATINDQQLHVNQWAQVSTLLSYSDANGDVATKYQFWDSGTAATSARFWTPGTSYWAANSTLEVSAADLANVWILGGSTTGSETLWVRAFDGTDWGAWDTFTMATTNATPVTAVSDHSLHTGQWATVGSWINVSDADNDAITKYQFWDSGTSATSAYFWTPTNSHWAANTVIDVSAGDLGSVWVQGGAATGSETLWVRAFDGTEWGAWDTFTLTTTINTAPVATINDHSLHVNEWVKPQAWLSTTDTEGDTITQYQFWDGGGGASSGAFWSATHSYYAAGTAIDVSASDLGNFWLRSGTASGSETMYVRAFDGTAWGNWDSFAFNSTNAAPVVTISNHTLNAAEWAKVVNWTATTDADGDAITKYQFWDGGAGAGSGYFWTPENHHWAAGMAIDVPAANLGDVWISGGATTGTESMYVRAFDGVDWSAWHAYTLSTIA